MDVYEVLRERLDACPPGAPQSETMYKILRLLFSPEEAEISCHLKFTLQSVSELAARTGWEESRLEKVLEGLATGGNPGCNQGKQTNQVFSAADSARLYGVYPHETRPGGRLR